MTTRAHSFVCATCGTTFEPSEQPPNECPICEDDRQYVPAGGQAWTTLERIRGSHQNVWPSGAGGAGVLLAGDRPQVCLDRKWATFMYSYPNWIPFDEPTVRRITASLEPLEFDRLYGAFGRNILNGAKEVIARSELRYLTAIGAARS